MARASSLCPIDVVETSAIDEQKRRGNNPRHSGDRRLRGYAQGDTVQIRRRGAKARSNTPPRCDVAESDRNVTFGQPPAAGPGKGDPSKNPRTPRFDINVPIHTLWWANHWDWRFAG